MKLVWLPGYNWYMELFTGSFLPLYPLLKYTTTINGLYLYLAGWLALCSPLRYTLIIPKVYQTVQTKVRRTHTNTILTLLKHKTNYILHVLTDTGGGSIFFSFLPSFHLSFAFILSPRVTHVPLSPPPSSSVSFAIVFTLSLPPSCLFHTTLQHLRINKLYISLCTHFKAPFRKATKLICPWASVYPKWLHQTWSWASGSPDCPCSFVLY